MIARGGRCRGARTDGARVIGGLITSIVLTLFVVPVVYTFPDDVGDWVSARPTPASEHAARSPCQNQPAVIDFPVAEQAERHAARGMRLTNSARGLTRVIGL